MVTDSPACCDDCLSEAAPPRSAVAAAGLLVVTACLAFTGWSLLDGQSSRDASRSEGITLAIPASRPASVVTLQTEPIPSARLFLDEAEGLSELPVVNAHLEVPLEPTAPARADSAPRPIHQLSHDQDVAFDSRSCVANQGAKLAGTIEALPD